MTARAPMRLPRALVLALAATVVGAASQLLSGSTLDVTGDPRSGPADRRLVPRTHLVIRRASPVALLRTALSVLLAGLALVLTATPALAHTELKTSNPADGSSLDAAPETVTLTFGEAVTLPSNPISVTGPDGSAWTVGTPTISGASVSAPVQPTGPAGQYFVHYTVIADDGDAVKGTVTFNLTTAASPATAEAATAEAAAPVATTAAPETAVAAPATAGNGSDSGSSNWVWVAVIVVVLGLVGAGFVITRRRRGVGSGTR